MAYSMDFRRAVGQAHDDCGSSIEVAEQFNCSASWVRRLIQQRRERGTLEPLTTARHDDQRSYDDADERAIRELIKLKPDATLAEVAEAIESYIAQANKSPKPFIWTAKASDILEKVKIAREALHKSVTG